VPADLVKVIMHGTLIFKLRVQHAPDLSTLCDALYIMQTEDKAASDNTARMLNTVKQERKTELKNATDTVHAIGTDVQQSMSAVEAAKAAAKEAVKVVQANLDMMRRIENAGPQTSGAVSYGVIAAKSATLASTPNTQVSMISLIQKQRGVVVTIGDPSTLQSLWAMSSCNLNAHAERAITHSGNENITHRKVLSSNKLKSGDLGIKIASIHEVEALKQFVDDWLHHIGNRAAIRITTYGSLHTAYVPTQ
jgi:hypothetical protein